MSNVHVASAANEVAQALPSTATVTVSKHGIQAIETLNLPAQSASDKALTWSRTFSGMEILTNPIIQYRTVTTFKATRNLAQTGSDKYGLSGLSTTTMLERVKKSVRPRSDPLANAVSSINVTINNASMAIQPARDHRIVNTFYPDENVVDNQRAHYGLNQLDQWAEPKDRTFYVLTEDDVEFQKNNNSLRSNYPCRLYAAEDTNGNHAQQNGNPGTYYLIDGVSAVAIISITIAGAEPGTGNGDYLPLRDDNGVTIGFIAVGDDLGVDTHYMTLLDHNYKPMALEKSSNLNFAGINVTLGGATISSGTFQGNMYVKSFASGGPLGAVAANPFAVCAPLRYLEHFKIVHDFSQPLAHPYFRDNVMRDNTLVNPRYFDCQITISDINKIVEATDVANDYFSRNGIAFGSMLSFPDTTEYTTTLLLSDVSGVKTPAKYYAGSTTPIAESTTIIKSRQPRFIFDLITPSVPLPTISDKVVSTFHTMTATPQSMTDVTNGLTSVKSGNIQLSQIPDKIYVFLKSSLMDDKTTQLQQKPSTRLGVCTELRIRTPQNSALLIDMDQESLYQMSVRNGSKKRRS